MPSLLPKENNAAIAIRGRQARASSALRNA